MRPEDFKTRRPTEHESKFQATCPFCPGNEDLTPSELYALWKQRQNHWEMRVIPDRFPVLAREGRADSQVHGHHRRVKSVGRHDVIVETPHHSLSLNAFLEVSIVPRLNPRTRLELGSGIRMNPLPPVWPASILCRNSAAVSVQ